MYVARRRRSNVSDQTRARIIGAVRELLSEGAFHDSTVEQVAERAGVSRATLYQHFGSRVGLVDAMCEAFDRNPALVALRSSDTLDEWIAKVVEFWAAEEKVLVELYGAAAVDPAAQALVERQRRDRQGELRRLLRTLGGDDRKRFAAMSVLTSFETYRELRRHVGLPLKDVVRTLQAAGRALFA
jgi:AcrR family transcriptional regulator